MSPLRDVSDRLTTELIVAAARATERGLSRNFGIEQPRLAVAGFNPHAGEGGALGTEEIEMILPAIEMLRAEGINIDRPARRRHDVPPARARQYDVALCLYHDQALIPLKTLHFDEGVNMTLGLPIVRTAPDHGTAFDIAGQEPRRSGRDDRGDPGCRRMRRARATADAPPRRRRARRRCRRCARSSPRTA